MNTTTVFDKKFSITRSTEYSLSIQVSLDGFSFLVQDLKRGKFCGLKHVSHKDPIHPEDLSKNLLKTLENEPLAEADYASVQIVYWTPKVTLIPAPLFDKDRLRSYFEFNTQLADNEAIYSQYIKNIGSYIAFAVPADISTITGQYFHNATFHCQSEPIIDFALRSSSSNLGKQVHLQISGNFFDISVTENGKLLLNNCFNYTNPADFTYFTLNVFEQFQLNPEKTPLYLSGCITKLSDEFNGLNRYIKDVQFSNHYSESTFTNAFSDKDLHRFASLIELQPCE